MPSNVKSNVEQEYTPSESKHHLKYIRRFYKLWTGGNLISIRSGVPLISKYEITPSKYNMNRVTKR